MRTILRTSFVLLMLGFTVLFNVGLVEIRIQEIDYLLDKASTDQEVSNALGIVAKYELIRRRLEVGEEDMYNYEFEAKTQALISGDLLTKPKENLVKKLYLIPVRYAVNAIRLALGKELLNPREKNTIFNVLEKGYFWERTRRYSDAIKIYDDVLKLQGVNQEIRSAVLLHKAFCHSMISDYAKAKNIYERVISQYSHTDAGMLAWRLLEFIDSMERRREQVKMLRLGYFETAKQFYLLMDYRNAIKHFSLCLANTTSLETVTASRFFKGRSHEELGETAEAIDEYRRVIRVDNTKRWARDANRRLLMLGEFYEQKRQISEEARRQLANYQDQKFVDNVDRFAGMIKQSSVKSELVTESHVSDQAILAAPDTRIMELINSVGDLTGKKEAEQQEKIEALRKQMIEEKQMTMAEINEVNRVFNLLQNPARQATQLQKVIRDNSTQLKYAYNKRLRQGIPLSGKMTIEIVIRANGSVASSRIIESNVGDQQFESEVLSRIGTWKFKSIPDSLGTYTLTYPFEFYQES